MPISEAQGGVKIDLTPGMSELTIARTNTLILAKASAVLLDAAGCEPTKFANHGRQAVFDDRKTRFTRRPVQVETGTEPVTKVIAEGWELTRQLVNDNEHFSNSDILVLRTSGDLAVVRYFSSFIMRSGYSKEGIITSVSGSYPQLGINGSGRDYEDPLAKEQFVQGKVANLVVSRGLHEGTMLEQTFGELASTPSVTQ